jgi:hypothetical protein
VDDAALLATTSVTLDDGDGRVVDLDRRHRLVMATSCH